MPEINSYFDLNFVSHVRNKIINHMQQCPNNALQYDESDCESVVKCDWFIRRFLAWRPTTVDTAVKTVEEAMKWRKKMGVTRMSDKDFPAEFYQAAACFSYLPDRDGNNILILRLKTNQRDPILKPEFEDLGRKYFVFLCEKIVSENPHRGFSIVFDCHGASLSNVDLDMTRFIISTLSNYYAGALAYACVYELPWIFNQLWKMIRTWLDSDAKKAVRFASKKDIHKLIAPENLPEYMGGIGTMNYRSVPKGVPNIEEVAALLGFKSQQEITKIATHFRRVIAEC